MADPGFYRQPGNGQNTWRKAVVNQVAKPLTTKDTKDHEGFALWFSFVRLRVLGG
jgi:hypothetical protein